MPFAASFVSLFLVICSAPAPIAALRKSTEMRGFPAKQAGVSSPLDEPSLLHVEAGDGFYDSSSGSDEGEGGLVADYSEPSLAKLIQGVKLARDSVRKNPADREKLTIALRMIDENAGAVYGENTRLAVKSLGFEMDNLINGVDTKDDKKTVLELAGGILKEIDTMPRGF